MGQYKNDDPRLEEDMLYDENGIHRQISKWHTKATDIEKDRAAKYVLHSCQNKKQPFDALQRKEALLYNLHNQIKAEISACPWLTNQICIRAVRCISTGENPFEVNCLPNGHRLVFL